MRKPGSARFGLYNDFRASEAHVSNRRAPIPGGAARGTISYAAGLLIGIQQLPKIPETAAYANDALVRPHGIIAYSMASIQSVLRRYSDGTIFI